MTTNRLVPCFATLLVTCILAPGYASLPQLDVRFQSARARSEGDMLIVTTGRVERTFRWTGRGLVTTSLRCQQTGKEWANVKPVYGADWSYPGFLPDDASAELRSLSAHRSNDEGFTSDHLQVVIDIYYPAQNLTLRQTIWAYPGADGLRQQLWAKGGEHVATAATAISGPPIITVLRGTPFANPQAKSVRPQWEVSTLHDARTVSFRLSNIHKDRRYVVGLTWWDFGNGGRTQSVEVASVDGETRVPVVPATVLPGWARDKQPAETRTFELPTDTNADGTVTINIQKIKVATANVSELWVWEYNAKEASAPLAIDAQRKTELQEAAPEGATLVAYLNAGGMGTRAQDTRPEQTLGKRVDYLPIDTRKMTVSAAGYYSDTQHRNKPDTPVLRQEQLAAIGTCDWANLLFLEDDDNGLTLVKESHKTVQTPGTDTGFFQFGGEGVENTGWCLNRTELVPDQFKWLWGTWIIAHKAGADERERAIKQFDRIRFPTSKARDMWLVMCTWGHSKNGDGRTYAYENQVLSELDHVADLGIDMLLIDDGWQAVAGFDKDKFPQPHNGWHPHPGTYPTGDWRNVRTKANELGLRLGLWAACNITTDEMVWNWQRLGQEQFKIDFARLSNHSQIDSMRRKARDFMLRTGHKCIISWDTTEASPRYGFYSFREYGNVHFMNRKPEQPGNVLYVPWLALRDFWLLARYQNLNKWQLVIQNPEVVVHESLDRAGATYTSDACQHGVDYCMATALMGTPEFMAVTRYYSEEARDVLRPLIARYKEVRDDIWDSTVYAIGDQPNNRSWTGFQAVHPTDATGYLTIFREIESPHASQKMTLRFIEPDTHLHITDLCTDRSWDAQVDEKRQIALVIDKAPGFLFLKYEK